MAPQYVTGRRTAAGSLGNYHGTHGRPRGWRLEVGRPSRCRSPIPTRSSSRRLGVTKLDLIRYYLAVADGALRGVAGRPMILKRFVKGITEEAVFQKRAPEKRPDYVDVAELQVRRPGTSAKEAVLHDAAGLVWAVNLGCVDLNPHPVRADDLDHPDELRVDLDPMPGVDWRQIVDVALVAREVLEDHGLTAWPKTSGSRGFHIYARIEPRWPYQVAAGRRDGRPRGRATRARAGHRRWWKEEREGVFVDFNQNAKDRTVASAYSVRATPDARVSTPLRWDEVTGCRPEQFTIATVPERFADHRRPVGGHGRRGRRPRRAARARRPARPAGEGAEGAEQRGRLDAADRDRAHQDQGRGDGRARHLARSHPRSRRRAVGAHRRSGRRDARAEFDLVPHPDQSAARAGRPAAGRRRS